MSLYEKILQERAEEERRMGRPLGPYRGVDSVVLDRLAGRGSDEPGYMSDLLRLHHFVYRGPNSWITGMWFGGLRNRYPEEYRLLRAERDGELYDQEDLFAEGSE